MIFGNRLGVEWSQHGKAHGLLRATVTCPPAGVEEILLFVDGIESRIDASCIDLESPALPVNIHTHLIANGPVALEIEVRKGGDRKRSATQRLEVGNHGPLAARVRDSLRATGVPIAYAGPCDAGRYDFADDSLKPWFDRDDADQILGERVASGLVSASDALHLRGFLRDGFIVLPGLLDDDLIDRALLDMQQAVDKGYQGYNYGESTRLEQMHVVFPAIRELWLHPEIHRFLELLYEVPSQPCQSLGYVFGSQQDAHQDTIHLTPFPAGYMNGVWIALEDVRVDSGELVVYPGSHRFPRVYMGEVNCPKVRGDWSRFGETVVPRWASLIAQSGIVAKPYLAKRGDVLIWHENLMHAGTIRRDPSLTRRSLVTHNFAKGSLAFYDSTGLAGITFDRH